MTQTQTHHPRPPSIVVDLDGTIALHYNHDGSQRRGHHEYALVGSDLPNQRVIGLVQALAGHYRVLFCSGRPDFHKTHGDVRILTRKWLREHLGGWTDQSPLFMRAPGDMRPDDIVKREIYHEQIEHLYDVHTALDDRDRVVAMWRSLGIVCLQVAPGDF